MKEFPLSKIEVAGNIHDIFLDKIKGGTWKYTLRQELTNQEIELLLSRQKEGWKILAIAKFKEVTKSLLHLKELGL